MADGRRAAGLSAFIYTCQHKRPTSTACTNYVTSWQGHHRARRQQVHGRSRAKETQMDTRKTVGRKRTHLETRGTPINKLDGALRLDTSDSCRRVLGYDITTVKQAHGHYKQHKDAPQILNQSCTHYICRLSGRISPAHGMHFSGKKRGVERSRSVPSGFHFRNKQRSFLLPSSVRATPSPRTEEGRR
jgi:hypothetical protein